MTQINAISNLRLLLFCLSLVLISGCKSKIPNQEPSIPPNSIQKIEDKNPEAVNSNDKSADTNDPIPPPPNPNNSEEGITINAAPSSGLCFQSDDQLSLQLSLFAEDMEKKKLAYDNQNPDRLQDCSGIFHQTALFVKSICDQYEYPDHKKVRDSRSIAGWYAKKKGLELVFDPMKERNSIHPGAVLFFGGSGKRYDSFDAKDLSAPYPKGIVHHIGVVTKVLKDDQGQVTGYEMFHGRRPGKTAQRSYYHNIKPPKAGYPILGNWNQQLLAIAPFVGIGKARRSPLASAAPTTQTSNDQAQATKSSTPSTSEASPSSIPTPIVTKTHWQSNQSFACFRDEATMSQFLTAFAEALEAQKLDYDNKNPKRLQDCSGIFHRVAQKVQSECPEGFDYPSTGSARDSRSLAKWYHKKENLVLIYDPVAQRNLIQPGVVMFFGGSGKFYQNFDIKQLGANYPKGFVEHIGVVTEVKRNAAGDITGYTMFHGRRPGKTAQRSYYHNIKPPRLGYPPLGNWNQQWLAVGLIATPGKPSS